MAPVNVTYFTDPGCPWAYSASPALAVLQWRYREQLRWRIVTIGLTEIAAALHRAGYTPARMTAGMLHFRRYGMPFATAPRARVAATARACRAIVATRLLDPARERDVLRALQFAWFTTPLISTRTPVSPARCARSTGSTPAPWSRRSTILQTLAAYEQDKRDSRTAEGGATEFQGKARQTDGPVRFSAPSLVFEDDAGAAHGGGRLPDRSRPTTC